MAMPALIWDVAEESLDEAEFLWRRRCWLLEAHEGTLRDVVTWAEERLLGALEGVRLLGDAAIASLLAPALGSDSVARGAAAAFVLAALNSPLAWDLLRGALLGPAGLVHQAVIRGLELHPPSAALVERLAPLLEAGATHTRVAVLELFAVWGAEPGPRLDSFLAAADPELLVASLRAIPAGSGDRFYPGIRRSLNDPEPRVQVAAIQRGLMLRRQEMWAACLKLFELPTPELLPLLPVVAVSGDRRALPLLQSAVGVEELARAAVFSLGSVGTREAAEATVELMAADCYPRLAAASFAAITGCDLRAEGLVKGGDTGDGSGEAVDPEASSPDGDLPAPDVGGVVSWWRRHQDRFRTGGRFLRGRGASWPVLCAALEEGPPARRHALADELELRSGGRFRLSTRALASDQAKQLRALRAMDPKPLAQAPITGWAALPSQ